VGEDVGARNEAMDETWMRLLPIHWEKVGILTTWTRTGSEAWETINEREQWMRDHGRDRGMRQCTRRWMRPWMDKSVDENLDEWDSGGDRGWDSSLRLSLWMRR
jgi:hypothetical protein